MKNLILFAFLALCFNLQAQKYRVMVATYDKGVPSTYFTDAGLSNVTLEIDHNNLYRYYMGRNYTTETEAIEAQNMAIEKGFPNARVIDLDAVAAECSQTCAAPATITLPETSVVGIIYFDFDKDLLRQKSKDELDILYSILAQNPDYKVRMEGHTDAKGTNSYNENLARRRGKRAKDYLVAKGISSDRISVTVKGEEDPAAKNNTETGKDLPQGRQYNRRVEFVLTDSQGRILSEMVEEVIIPEDLKAK